MFIRFGSKGFVRCLLAVGLLTSGMLAPVAAATQSAVCGPLGSRLSSGVPLHRSYSLYTDRLNRWRPLATDGNHVLVGWQIDWPWIAGIAYTSRLPAMPVNWRLWVGNAVTGRHFILDSYRAHRYPVAEFFPSFALNRGRVVWDYSGARFMQGYRIPAQRMAVEDLTTRRRTFLTAANPNAVLERIVFSGSRIVWQSAGIMAQKLAVDLWLYDLRSHRLTRLSRNRASSSSSLYPALAGRYLLFEQGPKGSDYGTPYLVDLTTKKGATTSAWWRAYHFWRLCQTGLTNTQIGNGLVSWEDGRLLDVSRSKVWFSRYWMVDAIAGRTALLEHQTIGERHITYVAWQFASPCILTGFS